MACAKCGRDVDGSFNFCPNCGSKLLPLIQKEIQDAIACELPLSVATADSHQPKAQDQAKGKAPQIKPPCDESNPTGDGTTQVDPKDAQSPAALETQARPPSCGQKDSDGTSEKTQNMESCKDNEMPSDSAPHSNDSSHKGTSCPTTTLADKGQLAEQTHPSSEMTPNSFTDALDVAPNKLENVKIIYPESRETPQNQVKRRSAVPMESSVDPITQQPGSVYVENSNLEPSSWPGLVHDAGSLAVNSFPDMGQDYIPVYFHAVTPQKMEFSPEESEIFLHSEVLFGDWRYCLGMTSYKYLGNKRYLVEWQHWIPKSKIFEDIPYKYSIQTSAKKMHKYEIIYQKNKDVYINRCLSVNKQLLTPKGEWHQFDDAIHLHLAKRFQSDRSFVIDERDKAGRDMLDTIFAHLNHWTEHSVGDFFALLEQFIHQYSRPVVHDGFKKLWELQYSKGQVKTLLRSFLEDSYIDTYLKKERNNTSHLHMGAVILLIYCQHLDKDMTKQLSNLCDWLCLPNQAQHVFSNIWEKFLLPLHDKIDELADAAQELSNSARKCGLDAWVLIIPLIHLLKRESQPFEPAVLVLNQQYGRFDSNLSKRRGASESQMKLRTIMLQHAYLMRIDYLLMNTWMPLLNADDVQTILTSVPVDLLNILFYLLRFVRSGSVHRDILPLRDMAAYLVNRENSIKSFNIPSAKEREGWNGEYVERCMKTAVMLLESVCHQITDTAQCDVPLTFLDVVCALAKKYYVTDFQSKERVYEESVGETLNSLNKWMNKTFKNKLLKEGLGEFSEPKEVMVCTKLLSLTFSHDSSVWTTTFLKNFERKLEKERKEDQIRIYTKKMDELRSTSPLLCNLMEKYALEAAGSICKDSESRASSLVLRIPNIEKFGKLMSVIMVKSWPTDADGHYIVEESLIFEFLLRWPMARIALKGTGGGRMDNMSKGDYSEEALSRMNLARSVFRSVTQKFLSGEIQIKTLKQILTEEHGYVHMLKIDGLCDDGRCKDNRAMTQLLKQRKEEEEAIHTEKELVKILLQICQELPQNVQADFQGLDSKLRQEIDTMILNEVVNVHTFDGQASPSIGEVTYFNLSENTRKMASTLQDFKDSTLFRRCWTNEVETLTQEQRRKQDVEIETYTLDDVFNNIFQSCYSNYKHIYDGLKSGDLSLDEVDRVFENYRGQYDDMQKDLNIMCRLDPTDDRKWISRRSYQIEHYHSRHCAIDAAKIIMDVRRTICPEGDFEALEQVLELDEGGIEKSLKCIDEDIILANNILKGITDKRRECLQVLGQCSVFVQWVKKAIEDIKELKVFVDLATIFAGDNAMDLGQVACFHDAVLGYSSILYGLQVNSDFESFKESLTKMWVALENDKGLPKKLRDTARLLEWFKNVKESHGSVEFSSLSLATSINENGIYSIKAQSQKKVTLETSLMLHIEDQEKKTTTCTYDDLKELQNKLMLMSVKKEHNQSKVECFAEVFENVQRLAKAFVDLHTAGNPIFRFWEAKIFCRNPSDACIIMKINFCNDCHELQVGGDLVEQVTLLSKQMELFFDCWQKFMDKQRSDHYYLNYFTAEQLFYLCSIFDPKNVNAVIEDKALMMMSFIKPNCTTSDVWSTWNRFNRQFCPGERTGEDFQFLGHLPFLNGNSPTADMCHVAADDPQEQMDMFVHIKKLVTLWNGYVKNAEIYFNDLLDIRSLGGFLETLTNMESQRENEAEEPQPSDPKDNLLRRKLPDSFHPNQPNLIICPQKDILISCICLYMASEKEAMPSYDEVLLCTPTTTFEEVELFLRRCLTPGYSGQKIYTMLQAELLSYDVCSATEECFQKLSTLFTHEYRLVIFCSSHKEQAYIPTAFRQFKREFVPKEPPGSIQKYLSRHFTVSSDYKNAMFKGGHSVGVVTSQRAGVGKSLYIQRLYENLERSVTQGAVFKKCIPLTEKEVDNHKVLRSLYGTPKDTELTLFHFDVTASVQKGLNEFLFKLLFLRYLMDSDGWMWCCSHRHLYVVEILERNSPGTGQVEKNTFLDIFPKVVCLPPKDVLVLESKREENGDFESENPLMDDECFKSEAYQRPYQYLKCFYNKGDLDRLSYSDRVEGTHATCLQILLLYCGVIDPSWAEIRNFVWFLNLQLKDCETSVFCSYDLIKDTLRGFKKFVVEFMILMSRDFATPSLCIADQSPGGQHVDMNGLNERDLAPFVMRKRWESEFHPYIFFNDDHTCMTFIGFHLEHNDQGGVDAINVRTKQVIQKNIMSKQLYAGLLHQGVPFNRNFDLLPRADKIEHLCKVLGIREYKDPDETYELTTDNMLKILAIHMRFRCGIPVIIMGETGCGKTRLIKFMCDLRKSSQVTETMKLVKVHGGISSAIVYNKVEQAQILARTNKRDHHLETVLFFDEANTTEAVSSIKEILCDHSVQGQPLDPEAGLQIIAACNPYKKHKEQMIEKLEASGLGYHVGSEETEDRLGSIPLRQLVYRVHVLPPSMIPLIWDFGHLSEMSEHSYIKQIVLRQTKANDIRESYGSAICQVLSSSQNFMRERDDECSFVSLRDVERCMDLMVWFHKNHSMFQEGLKTFVQIKKIQLEFTPASDKVIWSLLMATAVCYQACLEEKRPYLTIITNFLPQAYNVVRALDEIELMQDLLLSGVPMNKTIAKNDALKENFFMMVICVQLRIPLFIVGKPGSSKSLSKTLIGDAMQGTASHSEFFKRLGQIHLMSFQCSPHSTPEGIINTFTQCSRFQECKNLDEYISVVVLDEIGLAEDSPKMPLKTLHPLLEEGCIDEEPLPYKRVGFIGISNWALDPAKMNRGIFVLRGDPDEEELIKTAKGICCSEENLNRRIQHLFKPLAKAYMRVCQESKGFFGLRDFYSLIKMILSIARVSNDTPSAYEITGAVLRNFSGKDDVDVMTIFSQELREDFARVTISPRELINQSISPVLSVDPERQQLSHLSQEESRYLIILIENYAALQIVEQIFFSYDLHPEVIFGSSFPKDQEYTQICRNINRVKVCMETGQTVVLLNLQNLYESLYDALNQYYVSLGDQKYTDLGLGTHRVKCRVNKNFKLIVIEKKDVVYEQFPIPLINRLEKHYLDIDTLLGEEQKDIAEGLRKWANDFISPIGQFSTKRYVPSDVFIGYHPDTCSSVVLQVAENQSLDESQDIPDKAKDLLLHCATADSILRLDQSGLSSDEREQLIREYVKDDIHCSLEDYIFFHTQKMEQRQLFTEITTFSRLLTGADIQQLQKAIKLSVKLLSLHQFDTEYSFLKNIREFIDLSRTDKVLIIQTEFDESRHGRNILFSAKYSCTNEIKKRAAAEGAKTFVYFVIRLPRMDGGTSYVGSQGGLWRSVHIDDLRRSKELMTDVHVLKNLQMSDLFADPPEVKELEDQSDLPQNDTSNILALDTVYLTRSCVQSAVSMLRDSADIGELSKRRVLNLLTLLDESQTHEAFGDILRKRLHLLLLEYEAERELRQSWVVKEASNFSALQEGGTLLHTLWRRIQAVVTPLLANLVSIIDKDSNLHLLLNCSEDLRNLWLEIFASKDMLPIPSVHMENSTVLNVQSHKTCGVLMNCAMPFSWWIKDFLDGLMVQKARHKYHSHSSLLDMFANTPLGRYLAEKVNEETRADFFQRYLRDFVSMQIKVASEDELQLLFGALSCCADDSRREIRSEDELALPHIHIAYNNQKSRLHNLSRMFALQPEIISPLLNNEHTSDSPEMVLDIQAALACVELLGRHDFQREDPWKQWVKQVKMLKAPLDLICCLNNKQYGERFSEVHRSVCDGWRRIYIVSLFVQHLLLGFNHDTELKSLILKNSQTLSNVLSGTGSDVKSLPAFQGVIKVLKSCNQGVSDLYFRYGSQCGVCQEESQDPVQLPCLHIYCSSCIRQTLERNPNSCPMCRQNLPPDFQPRVSEDVRASLKKKAEFRKRCIGFFIDLLSSVCFRDSEPPTTAVVKHLLSYVTLETEHQGIHTKELSPFDESPDDNPVVRSVILKLLLKFRFDEVKGYLAQHLSRVESSIFLVEEDKMELYTLYINCLEDSMREKMPHERSNVEVMNRLFESETQFLCCLKDVPTVPATVSMQDLQNIARLRVSFTMAAELIGVKLAGNGVPDKAEQFLKMVTELCQTSGNDWYRVYLIRKIHEQQGFEVSQILLKEAAYGWLIPEAIREQNEDGGQIDQYLVWGDEYKAVRNAVAKAVVDGDVKQIEEAIQRCSTPRNRPVFFLLALFREVTTLNRSQNAALHPTHEQCQALEEAIRGSQYLQGREMKNFASALVHNNLGPLAVHCGHKAFENTFIEMTVHLAAVLLSSNNNTLKPLKQLGFSPGTMKEAFIPTMPDDYFAVVRGAVSDSWYVCPNDHPCVVGACGLPMEETKCNECGELIGGHNHRAVKGFTKIQGSQDRTKRGHILGDPEKRDYPDTKGIPLTPFILIRLVTHLAMLVGATKKQEHVNQIIHPRVENVCWFLSQHVKKDLDQLSSALGKGTDDMGTIVHLMLKSMLDSPPSNISVDLGTKISRNQWDETVASNILRPKLKDIDKHLQESKVSIRDDSRVSSNFIMRVTSGEDCAALLSPETPRSSQIHRSAVWSCRKSLSLLNLTHIMDEEFQQGELTVLRTFLEKEGQYRLIKFLPDILKLQNFLIKKFQNAPDQVVGSIGEFIKKQREMAEWYEKHIEIYLKTWNLLRVFVPTHELKIPEKFCSQDLDENSDLQYLLPRQQGPGLTATGLVGYLVSLHNELVYAVDNRTRDNSGGYKVNVSELTRHHVISYELEKDMLPLVLSNCQYSLERGNETMSQFDFPKIEQQIVSRFLEGKPHITKAGIPTFVNTQDRGYKTILATVKERVPQEALDSHTWACVSADLKSYSEVCDVLKLVDLLLEFLSMTGGQPEMTLDVYLLETLKISNIEDLILQALRRCSLRHCVSLWQLLASHRSKKMLCLRRDPFSGYSEDYQKPVTEDNKTELKKFVNGGNVDQWLLQMHEFLLLHLSSPKSTELYSPNYSLKDTLIIHLEDKFENVPDYVVERFPQHLLLSQIVETWKCAVAAKHD